MFKLSSLQAHATYAPHPAFHMHFIHLALWLLFSGPLRHRTGQSTNVWISQDPCDPVPWYAIRSIYITWFLWARLIRSLAVDNLAINVYTNYTTQPIQIQPSLATSCPDCLAKPWSRHFESTSWMNLDILVLEHDLWTPLNIRPRDSHVKYWKIAFTDFHRSSKVRGRPFCYGKGVELKAKF